MRPNKPAYFSHTMNNQSTLLPPMFGDHDIKDHKEPQKTIEGMDAISMKHIRKVFREQRALRSRNYTVKDYRLIK